MNSLSSGTDDVILDSGQTIGASTTASISSQSYSNLTKTYTPGTQYTFGANFLSNNQSISIIEGITSTINPELPCYISGSSVIAYSFSNYMSSIIPNWISIDSTSGALTITTPEVSSDTSYYFYINSAISGVSIQIQKLIKLTILNCSPSNWQKWLSTNSLICEVWNSGYNLTSGQWVIPSQSSSTVARSETASETAQALSTTTKSVVGATALVIVFTSLINISSMASFWMTINQLQLFFLLLLTRAFIPKDVKTVIEGSDFASNIYGLFPIRRFNLYPPFLRKFDSDLENQALEPFGIEYSSTVSNTTSIFACIFIMALLSIWVLLLKPLTHRFSEGQWWSWIAKKLHWIVDRIYRMLIFGYFIRNALEMSQYILISSVNEVHENNTTSTYRSISFIFAILMILIYVLMICLVLYLSLSSYRLTINNHNKLEEFYRGIKQNKKHKLYVVFLLLRRLVFIILLITCTFISSIVLIAIPYSTLSSSSVVLIPFV